MKDGTVTDAEAARAEFGAEFRDDISGFSTASSSGRQLTVGWWFGRRSPTLPIKVSTRATRSTRR
jgi:hypothetical protein